MRLILLTLAVTVAVTGGEFTQRRAAIADHVLVIGIDGLGAEGLQLAKAPAMRALIASGAHTLAARGVTPTVSSPNWASMIMGAGPEQHGVFSNEWEPHKHDIEPVARGSGGIFPTMFDALRSARRDAVIGIFHDWDGFARLVEPRVADAAADGDGPIQTVDAAVAFLRARRPALTFVHLDHVDHAGHELGWLSPTYVTAIERADDLVGRLLGALDETGMRPRTMVLISADHGGVGTKHGGLTRAELEIPWIVSGPQVKRGFTIDVPVSTVDTAAMVLHVLDVPQPRAWIGRPVKEALIAP